MKHALTTAALILSFTATGCSSGARIAKTNDKLRLERETLREQIEQLVSENAELKAKVSELTQLNDASHSDDVIAALPRVASIELTRYCQIEETDEGPIAIVFISTKDGRGRFAQAVGTISIVLANSALPTESDDSNLRTNPESLGHAEFGPLAVRDAYTTGLSGTSYMFKFPLHRMPEPIATIGVRFDDAMTGDTHFARAEISP